MSLVTPPHSAQGCLRTSANGQKPNKIRGGGGGESQIDLHPIYGGGGGGGGSCTTENGICGLTFDHLVTFEK